MNKSNTISLRLKREEYFKIEAVALKYGMSPNAFTQMLLRSIIYDKFEATEPILQAIEDVNVAINNTFEFLSGVNGMNAMNIQAYREMCNIK